MRKKINNYLMKFFSSREDIRSNIFILVSVLGEISMILAIIGDIIIGENLIEILVLLVAVTMVPIITWLSLRSGNLQVGSIIMSVAILLLVVPAAFFFGGGLTGGGVIWFILAFVYIGLSVKGRACRILVVLLALEIVACYILSYYFPYFSTMHKKLPWYIDSCISVLLVGFLCYFTVVTQYRLYAAENEKAKAQAKEIDEMNKAQSKFFSSMSNEIRTPINTIIGLNEMTLRENAGEEVAENSRNIQAASKILLSLINDILDIAGLSIFDVVLFKVMQCFLRHPKLIR